MRTFTNCMLIAGAACVPVRAAAQESAAAVVGAGVGGTYYCIVSRCDTGTTILGMGGYAPAPFLLVEAAVRWHQCFDCDRFVIVEGGLQLRYPGRRLEPFVAGGVGLSSDPEFMGDQFGLHAAAGTWIRVSPRWGLKTEVRGRQVGGGDLMGEASVAVAYRFLRGPS